MLLSWDREFDLPDEEDDPIDPADSDEDDDYPDEDEDDFFSDEYLYGDDDEDDFEDDFDAEEDDGYGDEAVSTVEFDMVAVVFIVSLNYEG